MPWCPKCETEYREGITECVDCGSLLVENLLENQEAAVLYGEQEQLDRFLGFLKYSRIESGRIDFDEARQQHVALVDKEWEAKALKLGAVFMAEETKRAAAGSGEAKEPKRDEVPAGDSLSPEDVIPEEEKDGNQETEEDADTPEHRDAEGLSGTEALKWMYEKKEKAQPYEKKEEKAKNFISSAYVLIPVGAVGLAAMILCFMGVLDFHLGAQTKYMTYGVLTFLFVVFIAAGLSSYLTGKKYEKYAALENDLEKEIHVWFTEHFPKEMIDEEIPAGEGGEEVLYFRRTEWMKERLYAQFKNAEDGLLEAVSDEIYQEYYGE